MSNSETRYCNICKSTFKRDNFSPVINICKACFITALEESKKIKK